MGKPTTSHHEIPVQDQFLSDPTKLCGPNQEDCQGDENKVVKYTHEVHGKFGNDPKEHDSVGTYSHSDDVPLPLNPDEEVIKRDKSQKQITEDWETADHIITYRENSREEVPKEQHSEGFHSSRSHPSEDEDPADEKMEMKNSNQGDSKCNMESVIRDVVQVKKKFNGRLSMDNKRQEKFQINACSGQSKNSKAKETSSPANIGSRETKRKNTGLTKLFPAVVKRLGVLLTLNMVLLPRHAAASHVNSCEVFAYEANCSAAGSSREDKVLDLLDVNSSKGDDFDGSGRGYSRICSNTFHDVKVENIDLQNNSLYTLPSGIFNYTIGLQRVDLSNNNFTEFPSALNSSTHVTFLNMSSNHIEFIPRGTMNGMIGIHAIDFSKNENMVQVPGDIFWLMKHSLKRVILTGTRVQHPLLPVPQNTVCTKENPCDVTHEKGSVSILVKGTKVTFKITGNGNMTCEKVKQSLEGDFEVLDRPFHCDKNNVLNGTVKIVRKDIKGTETSTVPIHPVLNRTTESTTVIDQDTCSATNPGIVIFVGLITFAFGVVIGVVVGVAVYNYRVHSINTHPTITYARGNSSEQTTETNSTSQNFVSVELDNML